MNAEDRAKVAALKRKAAALRESGNPEKASELQMQADSMEALEAEAMPDGPRAYPNPPDKVAKEEPKPKVADTPKAAEARPQVRRGTK